MIIDKIYIINLKHATNRLHHVYNEFKKIDLDNVGFICRTEDHIRINNTVKINL
jgi:hypothetical protein